MRAVKLLTDLEHMPKHSADSVLQPSSAFTKTPSQSHRNNCKLKTEDNYRSKYNKFIFMELNPTLPYPYVMLININMPQVLVIDTLPESISA